MSVILFFIVAGIFLLGILSISFTICTPFLIIYVIYHFIKKIKNKKNVINVDIKQNEKIIIDIDLVDNENIKKIEETLRQANIPVIYSKLDGQMIISKKSYKYNDENVEEFLRDNERR